MRPMFGFVEYFNFTMWFSDCLLEDCALCCRHGSSGESVSAEQFLSLGLSELLEAPNLRPRKGRYSGLHHGFLCYRNRIPHKKG